MKRYIYSLLFIAVSCTGIMLLGCTDTLEPGGADPGNTKDCITFELGISGAITRGTQDSPGQDLYNEDKFASVAVFMYEPDGFDEASSEPVLQETAVATLSGSVYSVAVSLSSLKEQIEAKGTAGMEFKVYAVANCADVSSLEKPTVATLKETTTVTSEFRSEHSPTSFVMTNFNSPSSITVKASDQSPSGNLTFRRVAAKIRTAVKVAKAIYQKGNDYVIPSSDEEEQRLVAAGYNKWEPDYGSMRLYISNGVRKSRLDGDVSELTLVDNAANPSQSDYYNVITSGSKDDNSDFNYSRVIAKHDDSELSDNDNEAEKDEDYLYYNSVPYYSYPNEWAETVTESHQTMLTIVVPWRDASETYKPTYYSIPVNNNGKIVSNAYYYLRANINMMGSETPEVPMPVEIECEIANWGNADNDVDVSLRPLRFLIFSQNEFVMNNEKEISIPFSSTHKCKVTNFKGIIYGYNRDYGSEREFVFDDETTYNGAVNSIKGVLYNYSIDSDNFILNFDHRFIEGIFNTQGTDNIFNYETSGLRGNYTESITSNGSTYLRKKRIDINEEKRKLYTRVKFEITVQHSDNSAYEQTVYITAYPSAYVTVERVDRGLSPSGLMYVNGYNTSHGAVQNMGGTNAGDGNSGDLSGLVTITVTQLDEDEKEDWVINDPRTNYINNDLSGSAHLTDTQDMTDVWKYNNVNGAFDGTTSTWSSGTCRTIWEYYGADDVKWSGGTWKSSEDKSARTLKYYYPAAEGEDKGNIIAPKFIIAGIQGKHTGTNDVTRENARRRCATYQQYGYPAGRWRLPTFAEILYVKKLQRGHVILDVFYSQNNSSSGAGTTWSNRGITNANGLTGNISGESYTRCVYDLWYWEKVDAEGISSVRIPNDGEVEGASDMALWKIFTWGDRPKESVITRGGNSVQSFLQSHSKGNYVVIRDGDDVRLEKMK